MKLYARYLFCCFYCLVYGSQIICAVNASPLLVVVLMVKNEEAVMASTLQPFADAGVNAYLVLDTGSGDRTIKNTEDFFITHGITQGYIEQQPFVDFATSRNYALSCAEEKFPNAGFLLMLDAEWRLHNVEGLLKFCAENLTASDDSYLIRIDDPWEEFFVQRLIRPRCGLQFEGVVHETLTRVTPHSVPYDVFFTLCTTEYGRKKTVTRWKRDCDLLLKEFERDPQNPRTLFYLGQTYACLGDLEQSRIFYEKRCAVLHAPLEENFIAHYRLAKIHQEQDHWDLALQYYLKAFSLRPTRIEPLVALADYYLKHGQFELSYLFARRAYDRPYPEDDYLFIEKEAYNYTRYDILGQAAWYTKDYEIGEAAVRKALKVKPEMVHLYHNLAYYLHRNLF